MTAPLNLAWLTWGDEGGGVASAVLNNALGMQRLGHRVRILHIEDGRFSADAARAGLPLLRLDHSGGSHAHYLALGFGPRGLLRRVRFLFALRAPLAAALASSPPDLLCLPWPDLPLLAGPVCRRLGIGLVLEMPATPSRYPFDLNQRAYAWVVRRWRILLLANSTYTANHLTRVPGVEVMPPLIDWARFDPARVKARNRAELGLPEHAIVIGQIARLDPPKGADLLIEALAALAPGLDGLPVHLLLVGGPLDSPYARGLRSLAKIRGVHTRVHWIGHVEDPERYWPCCDLALNARRDPEPLGLSVVEAMLMQRPALVHALGGPATTVRDGVTGWHFHAPTIDAVILGLRRALAARDHWSEFGRRARTEALQHYAGPPVLERYVQLLRSHAAVSRQPD